MGIQEDENRRIERSSYFKLITEFAFSNCFPTKSILALWYQNEQEKCKETSIFLCKHISLSMMGWNFKFQMDDKQVE